MIEELRKMLRGIDEAIYYEETSQNGFVRLLDNLYARKKTLERAIRDLEKLDRKMERMNERGSW